MDQYYHDTGQSTKQTAGTALQPSLFADTWLEPIRAEPAGGSIEEEARAWMELNPAIVNEFVRRALEFKMRGYRRYGAKAIIEAMRWDYAYHTKGDPFKFNNNFTSRLVRRAIELAPELADLFEMRELRS